MSKLTSAVLASALAAVAVVSLAACSAGSSSGSSAAPKSKSSSSSSADGSSSKGTPDAAVVNASYATDAEVCSAVFKSISGSESDLASAMTGDSSKAVTALQNLAATMNGVSPKLKSDDNKKALQTLAGFYQDYATAIQAKDAKKISDLQAGIKTGAVGDASDRLGQCVVGR